MWKRTVSGGKCLSVLGEFFWFLDEGKLGQLRQYMDKISTRKENIDMSRWLYGVL